MILNTGLISGIHEDINQLNNIAALKSICSERLFTVVEVKVDNLKNLT